MRIDWRLSLHHIGGRAGSRGFPVLTAFERDIVNVLYDADADCIAQIRERNAEFPSELHVVPVCLGSANGPGTINITYDPFTSSVFELDSRYGDYYSISAAGDYPLHEACRIVERRPIDLRTADDVFQSGEFPAPLPDFLSIDTEGSEYEILCGARDTLRSTVLGVVLEADLHPVFKGQKIFGDHVQLLSEAGFEFTRFLHLHEMFHYRVPLGLRGEGAHGTSDALFLRRIDTLDDTPDPTTRNKMLLKLAFIAITFKQIDYAVECLRRVDWHAIREDSNTTPKLVYLQFLREFHRLVTAMPTTLPPTFAQQFPTFASSKARFAARADAEARDEHQFPVKSSIKRLLGHWPTAYKCAQTVTRTSRMIGALLTSCRKHLRIGRTPIEKLLVRYGLHEQADCLREKRTFQS